MLLASRQTPHILRYVIPVFLRVGVLSGLHAQTFDRPLASASYAAKQDAAVSSSVLETTPAEAATASSARPAEDSGHVLAHSIGAAVYLGVNGAGVDLALPVAKHLNLRVGGQYLQYSGTFVQQGATVSAAMKVGNGKLSLDWFPFHNGFHLSPQFYFANQTDVQATVTVPGGSTITLDGKDYSSSTTDPLYGTGHVSTRKLAPGFAVGWGNISPRSYHHWSFPVELGFYYIGQPKLDVTFRGSACDPSQPPAIGCEQVTDDPGFQADLARFIARNNHNLSYASFFPVAQFGVGYRF